MNTFLTDKENELLARRTAGRVTLSRENKKRYDALKEFREYLQGRISAYEHIINAYQNQCPEIFKLDNRFDFCAVGNAQKMLDVSRENLTKVKANLKTLLGSSLYYQSAGGFPRGGHEKQAIRLIQRIERFQSVLDEKKKVHPNWFFEGGDFVMLREAIDNLDRKRRLLADTDKIFGILSQGYNVPQKVDDAPIFHKIKCMVCQLPIYSERSLRFRLMNGEKYREEVHGRQHEVECPRCHCVRRYFIA